MTITVAASRRLAGGEDAHPRRARLGAPHVPVEGRGDVLVEAAVVQRPAERPAARAAAIMARADFCAPPWKLKSPTKTRSSGGPRPDPAQHRGPGK